METKYSPTPWFIQHEDSIKTEDGKILICRMPNYDRAEYHTAENAANAAHIVKCVNSHDKLLAALKAMADHLAGLNWGSDDYKIEERAREAIAEAEAV